MPLLMSVRWDLIATTTLHQQHSLVFQLAQMMLVVQTLPQLIMLIMFVKPCPAYVLLPAKPILIARTLSC